MANKPTINFRDATRLRIQPAGGPIPFAQNSTITLELPRVGFLTRIFIALSGSINRAAGSAVVIGGRPQNIIKRFRLNLNQGTTSVTNVSGYGLARLNAISNGFNFPPDFNGADPIPIGAVTSPNGYYNFDVTVLGAPTAFLMGWIDPVAANPTENFLLGTINLQSYQTRCTLEIQTGAIADLFDAGAVLNLTAFDLSFQIFYEYAELPPADKVVYPPNVLHIIQEDQVPFSVVGDVVYTVPKQGFLLRAVGQNIVNTLNNNNFNELRVRVNITDDFIRMNNATQALLYQTRYGHGHKNGEWVIDFWYASGLPAFGDFRDTIDTESISTLDLITNIGPQVLGVNNNFVNIVREILVKY